MNLSVPFTPSFDQALRAAEAFTDFRKYFYPTRFVCGPARKTEDGLRIFAGPPPGKNGIAAPWIPHRSLCDDTGRVNTEYIWAALDCPGYFAINRDTQRYMLLGRLTAALRHNRICHPYGSTLIEERRPGAEIYLCVDDHSRSCFAFK